MQKDKILKKIIVLCFFIFYNFNSFGLTVPPLSGPVVDKAGILSRSEFEKIENFLLDLDRKSKVQIAVLIISSLEGESIEDYSMQVAEEWKLGDKEKDSGALLVVAVKDKKLRIEVGYGLEENLTDSRSGQIIRSFIAPQFRSGNYGEGIYDGIKAMAAYASEDESLLKEIAVSDEDDEGGFPQALLFFLFVYLMISKFSPGGLFWIFYLLSRSGRAGRSFNGRSSSRGSFFGGSIGRSSGRGFSGGGFSGGGGSFGGGGASGGW